MAFNETTVTTEAVPALKLVRAALLLLIRDGMEYLQQCHNPPTTPYYKTLNWIEKEAAFNDLCKCGRMTRHLADLNQLDPEVISEKFRRNVRRYYSEFQPEKL